MGSLRIFLLVIIAVTAGCKNRDPKQSQQKAMTNNPGKQVYNTYCLACHQADGSGVPGMYPPLKKADWAHLDDEKIITIVLQGYKGEIEVDGDIYNGQMPSQHFLTDKQVADVLTWLRTEYGNIKKEITPQEVSSVRKEIEENKK